MNESHKLQGLIGPGESTRVMGALQRGEASCKWRRCT